MGHLNRVEPVQTKLANSSLEQAESKEGKSFAPPEFNLEASSEEPIQGNFADFVNQESKSPENASSGSSVSLPDPVQAKMEQSMGADFSGVQMFKDSEKASSVGANAFAQGNEVHFAPGQFKTDQAGQELIGHELAHVVQQREGRVSANTSVGGKPVNDDKGLEQEADDKGRLAAKADAPLQGKAQGGEGGEVAAPVLQGSFISFALKAGAKKGSKAMLKNFIETKIKQKLKNTSLKRLRTQFAKEADTLIDILTDSWWETAIGFIPVVGDAFDLVNVPRKIAKAIKTADRLEAKIKAFNKIQHVHAGKLIPDALKRVKDYPIQLEGKTVAEIMNGKGKAYNTMRKLLQQQERLGLKNFGQ